MREFLTPKPYLQGSPYGYNKIKSGIIGIILKQCSSTTLDLRVDPVPKGDSALYNIIATGQI